MFICSSLRKSHNKINIGDIPLEIIIDGTEFQFLCATVFVNKNHFKAIFRLNGQNYLIDDFKAGFNKNIPKNMKQIRSNIPYMFDYWTDPVVHLLLLSSSKLRISRTT